MAGPGRRATRSARSSRSRSRSRKSGGISGARRRSDLKRTARKWVNVERPPAPGIGFNVSQWVPEENLTSEERERLFPQESQVLETPLKQGVGETTETPIADTAGTATGAASVNVSSQGPAIATSTPRNLLERLGESEVNAATQLATPDADASTNQTTPSTGLKDAETSGMENNSNRAVTFADPPAAASATDKDPLAALANETPVASQGTSLQTGDEDTVETPPAKRQRTGDKAFADPPVAASATDKDPLVTLASETPVEAQDMPLHTGDEDTVGTSLAKRPRTGDENFADPPAAASATDKYPLVALASEAPVQLQDTSLPTGDVDKVETSLAKRQLTGDETLQ